jgi:transcriptional antiterminator NusG
MPIAECLDLESGLETGELRGNPWAIPSRLQWFAIQVRSRQEARVAQQLGDRGLPCFLPARKVRRLWSDRIREKNEPIFPGYLFCRFDFSNRHSILTTPRVIQIVEYDRRPVPVDEIEIRALQTLMASGFGNQTCSYLEIGDRVRIESGPLRGLEGIMTDARNGLRLVISVSLLRRSVAVEIDSALVGRLQ